MGWGRRSRAVPCADDYRGGAARLSLGVLCRVTKGQFTSFGISFHPSSSSSSLLAADTQALLGARLKPPPPPPLFSPRVYWIQVATTSFSLCPFFLFSFFLLLLLLFSLLLLLKRREGSLFHSRYPFIPQRELAVCGSRLAVYKKRGKKTFQRPFSRFSLDVISEKIRIELMMSEEEKEEKKYRSYSLLAGFCCCCCCDGAPNGEQGNNRQLTMETLWGHSPVCVCAIEPFPRDSASIGFPIFSIIQLDKEFLGWN